MNRYLLSAAGAAVAAVLATSATANTLYFQMNPNLAGSGEVRQAFIFGAANSTGTVVGGSGFSQAFDLGAEGFAVVNVPLADQLATATVQNLGFRIDSTSSLSGYFLSRRDNTTDMTYLIDGARLGTDYVVAGYQNIFPDQMSVQATVDGTVVTFRPKGAAEFNVTLDAGQTYMYAASTQLTGSRITSTNPIAVFSGNQCTNIPTGNSACDHLVEQMPSVDVLSNTYLVAQTPRTGTGGNVVRVVATADASEIRVNGALVATLNAGDYYEGRVVGGQQIDSNNKILVAEYLIGQTQAGANTDPAMTIVPGADQWLNSYVFATPSGTADFPADFVSIIINTADISTLTVDGILANPSLFNPLGTTAFSFGDIDVSLTTGPFSITAANPFQLLLSGFDDFDSYFTYGGAAFSPGASPPPDTPPPPPPPPPGSQFVYWDGDGAASANNGIIDGGDGVWTATKPNFTEETGATNAAWTPQPSTVIFQGTGGAVEVDDSQGDIVVSGLAFLVTGYNLFGDKIILDEGDVEIQVGDATPLGSTVLARIDTLLTGAASITKVGNGTLSLTVANDYSGGTFVSQGTLIGLYTSFGSGPIDISEGAQLVVDHSLATGTLPNTLGGAGRFFKQGTGTLTIDGVNELTGETVVAQGRLLVNGDLGGSPVTVQSGAVLGGTGTVGGIAALAGAVVQPGNSGIGVLAVGGTYSQAATSVYQAEVTSTGTNDRIVVTGAATLAPGAVLNVTKLDAPRYVLGTRYTVLTADGGLTGTYALTGTTRVSQFINLTASYDARNAYLGATKTRAFSAAGATPNQIAAAGGADAAGNGALYTAIAYLQTDAEAQDAFDQISGELHASVRGATLEDSRFVREAVVNHLMSPEEAQRGIWLHGYGSWGSFDGDGNAADVNRDIGGFFLGGDLVTTESLTIGLLAGYGSAKIRVDDRNSEAKTDDIHIGAYVGFDSGAFAARGGLAYMWRDVKTTRSVGFTGFSDLLTADYKNKLFQVYGDIGYTIQAGSISFEPFAALAYVHIDTTAFNEIGGAARLQSVRNQSDDFWTSTLGARATVGIGTSASVTAMAGWRHIGGGDLNTPLQMNFAAGPSFDIGGYPVAEDAASLGLKVTARLGASVDGDLGYSGQVGSGISDHGLKASVRFRF